MLYYSIISGLQDNLEQIITFLRPNKVATQSSTEDAVNQLNAKINKYHQQKLRWADDTAYYLVCNMQHALEERNRAKERIMTELTKTCGLLRELCTIVLGYIPHTRDKLEEIVSQFFNEHDNNIHLCADALCPYRSVILHKISQYKNDIHSISLNTDYLNTYINLGSKFRIIGFVRLATLSKFFPNITHIKLFNKEPRDQDDNPPRLPIAALIHNFTKLQLLDTSEIGASEKEYTRAQLIECVENNKKAIIFFPADPFLPQTLS